MYKFLDTTGAGIRILLKVVACFEHNRRHKEKASEPEIPMSRVYCLKNNSKLTGAL
jgi:hypothetical protein